MIKSSNVKEKKQTRSKIAPSSLCYFKHNSIYCESKKFYILKILQTITMKGALGLLFNPKDS